MRICLIGNSGLHKHGKNGQTLKVNLYKEAIVKEGFEVAFVDLEYFSSRPLLVLYKIRSNIRNCDRIVLISGERGCRLLIPFINHINKKHKKPFILPLIGSSVLHFSVNKLSNDEMYRFYIDNEFDLGKLNKRICEQLKKIDYVLPETILLSNIFTNYFQLNNCFVLNNFRFITNTNKPDVINKHSRPFRIVFLSRIVREKGIFDFLEATKNYKGCSDIFFDIYGDIRLDEDDVIKLYAFVDNNISIHNPVPYEDVVCLLAKCDLMVFPTRFVYEGTPGVISESLLAGTPILASNFPNALYLLKDGYDSIFYEMFNVDDLKAKLEWCINNKDKIRAMRQNCLESSKRFTYEYNRKDFLKYVCGVEEK